MKKFPSAFLLLALSLFLIHCGENRSPGASLSVQIETFESVSFDNPDLEAFHQKALNYDVNDYSYTLRPNGVYQPVPVTFRWSFPENTDVSKIQTVFLRLATNEGFTDASYRPCPNPRGKNLQSRISVYNLLPNRKYYWKIVVRDTDGNETESDTSSFQTNGTRRILQIDGIQNARDFGGLLTENGNALAFGRVFRSGQTDHVKGDGIGEIETLGIKTELDLRGNSEIKARPFENKLNYIQIPGTKYDTMREDGEFEETFFTNPDNTTTKELLVFTDPDNYPILVHCRAGADRTGCICAFLQALCGVRENELVADYEITPNRYRNQSDDGGNGSIYYFSKWMERLKSYEGETLQEKARNAAVETFGLTEEQILIIQSMLFQ